MYQRNDTIKEKLYCKTCKRGTNHKCLVSYFESSTQYEDPDFDFTDEYYIIQCLGCDTVAFFREYHDEGMVTYYSNGHIEVTSEKWIYPEEPKNAFEFVSLYEKKKMPACPKDIYTLYSQVIDAFNTDQYLLCSVGLRMIVEAVCNSHGIVRGPKYDEAGVLVKDRKGKEIILKNIEGKINALKATSKISITQMQVLHEIRRLGNISAHETKVPEYKILYSAIGIVEHCLIDIFEHATLKLVDSK